MIIALVNVSLNLAKEVEKQIAEKYNTTALPWKLNDIVYGSVQSKDSRLQHLKQFCRNRSDQVFLIYSLVFQEEVEFIRSIGGFIWHLDGCLSDIPINRRDELVTTKDNFYKAFVPIDEAISKCIVKRSSFNPMPEPSIPWRIHKY